MQNRVLLVEDDDELRELLARYLSGQGLPCARPPMAKMGWR